MPSHATAFGVLPSLLVFYFVVFNMEGWLFILPFVALANLHAETWIWESVPKEGRRRLRRLWAEQARGAKTAPSGATGAKTPDEDE